MGVFPELVIGNGKLSSFDQFRIVAIDTPSSSANCERLMYVESAKFMRTLLLYKSECTHLVGVWSVYLFQLRGVALVVAVRITPRTCILRMICTFKSSQFFYNALNINVYCLLRVSLQQVHIKYKTSAMMVIECT